MNQHDPALPSSGPALSSSSVSRRGLLRGGVAGALGLAAAPLLAACGSSKSGSGSGGGGVKNITMWGSFNGDQVKQINTQLAAFNSSQSAVHVTYQAQDIVETKLLTAIASGTNIPDVVLWDRYQTSLYAPKGALSAIDDLIARDKVDTSDFFPAPYGEMTVGGKQYGLPMLVDNRSLVYNKTMLDKAGIKPPTTWEELATAAQVLTQRDSGGKLKVSGFALDDPGLFNVWILQAGGQMLAADKKTTAFNSPAGQAVLSFWDDLLHNKKVYELGFAQGVDGFGTGQIAMKYDGPWNMPQYDKISGFEYGVVPPPAGPGGKGAITGGFGLVIPAQAKHRDAAWEFVKWWTTVPANGVAFAKIGSWLPGSVKASQDPYFGSGHWPAFVQTEGFAVVRPNVPGYSDVEGKALEPQLQNWMSGKTDAASALKNAASQGDQILAKGV